MSPTAGAWTRRRMRASRETQTCHQGLLSSIAFGKKMSEKGERVLSTYGEVSLEAMRMEMEL